MPIQKITTGVVDASVFSSPTITTPTISGNLSLDSTGTTGVRVPSANTMTFHTAGTEDMRITSAGDVGIGTSSPATRLNIADIGSGVALQFNGYTGGQNIQAKIECERPNFNNFESQLRFYTHNGSSLAEKMRIDQNGYVTMPYQPAFLASRTAGTLSATGVYICNSVTFNDGSHYNSTTGRFTAPVAGRYQMNFFLLAQNANNFDINIRVNGTLHAGFDIRCNNGAIGGNFTLATSGVLKLSANDIVDPFISSFVSGPIYGSGLSGFSMYFLG
jgi:hypothetical protein